MSINRTKRIGLPWQDHLYINVLRSRLRDGAHVLQNASATFSPLPFQQLPLCALYPSLPSTLALSSIPCHPSTLSFINSSNFSLSLPHIYIQLITKCPTSSTSPTLQFLHSLSSLLKTRHLLNHQLCRSSQFHQPPPPPLTLHHHTYNDPHFPFLSNSLSFLL